MLESPQPTEISGNNQSETKVQDISANESTTSSVIENEANLHNFYASIVESVKTHKSSFVYKCFCTM